MATQIRALRFSMSALNRTHHVNLERMKRGCSLLDSHDRFGGIRSQLGVVQDVWVSGDELHGQSEVFKKGGLRARSFKRSKMESSKTLQLATGSISMRIFLR
jgi:hypothetical protein